MAFRKVQKSAGTPTIKRSLVKAAVKFVTRDYLRPMHKKSQKTTTKKEAA